MVLGNYMGKQCRPEWLAPLYPRALSSSRCKMSLYMKNSASGQNQVQWTMKKTVYVSVLGSLGITNAFNNGKADFSLLSSKRGPVSLVSKFAHRYFVEVNSMAQSWWNANPVESFNTDHSIPFHYLTPQSKIHSVVWNVFLSSCFCCILFFSTTIC